MHDLQHTCDEEPLRRIWERSEAQVLHEGIKTMGQSRSVNAPRRRGRCRRRGLTLLLTLPSNHALTRLDLALSTDCSQDQLQSLLLLCATAAMLSVTCRRPHCPPRSSVVIRIAVRLCPVWAIIRIPIAIASPVDGFLQAWEGGEGA